MANDSLDQCGKEYLKNGYVKDPSINTKAAPSRRILVGRC